MFAQTEAPAVSQAQLARRLGVSRQRVHQYIASGVITVPALRPDGLVDPVEAERQVAERVRVEHRADATLHAAVAVRDDARATARRRREEADAELAELRLAKLRGEMVDRRAVANLAAEIGALIQAAHREAAADLAAAARTQPDEAGAIRAVVLRLDDLLRKIADAIDARAAALAAAEGEPS